MQIGQLSTATACPVETIRYYEKQGLLPAPARSAGNYRIYAQAHQDRLVFIRRCRSLDMSLEEIRSLLLAQHSGPENCHGIDQLLRQHLDHVAARIRELQGLKTQLRALLSACSQAGPVDDCGALKGLTSTAVVPTSTSHVRTHNAVGGLTRSVDEEPKGKQAASAPRPRDHSPRAVLGGNR